MSDVVRSEKALESEAGGDLGRVIEVERAIEAGLAEAKAESRRMVEEAASGAREREERLEAELLRAHAELRAEAERARQETVREIDESARREAAKLDAVTGERVRDLAAWVVRSVIEGEG